MTPGTGGRPWRRSPVLVAAIAALTLRLAFGLGYWVDKPLTHDEQEYLELARNVAEGRGLSYGAPDPGDAPRERFGRAPVYPLFLSAVRVVAGASHQLVAIRIVQAAIGAVAVLLVAAIAARAAGPRAGALAAWCAAVYPPLVWIPAYVFSETLYMTLALANVLAADRVVAARGARAASPRDLLACGVLGGVAALTRPAHLFFLALLGGVLVLRRRPVSAAVVAAGALLLIAPWTARNYREYGRFVLIASEGGITFWTGNHPLAIGDGDLAANPAIKQDNLRVRAQYPDRSPEELEPVYYREAFEAIAANPLRWAALLIRKAFYLIVPAGPSYTLHSARYLGASLAAFGLVLPLAVGGGAVLVRTRRWPHALGLLIGSAVLVGLVFFPQERFRIPVIDPAAIVLAASGLALTAPRPGARPS